MKVAFIRRSFGLSISNVHIIHNAIKGVCHNDGTRDIEGCHAEGQNI